MTTDNMLLRRTRVASPWAVLLVACLATFAINLDTNLVNVALPALNRQLGATTRDLQWIVDAYNLAFAALVLGAGSLGDRFGRRPVLILGLLGFAVASAVGGLVGSSGALIVVRLVMGVFAALIFPTTLSIIANAFPDRATRAKAIGIWGGVVGIAVAAGPVTGGFLLVHFWWGSVFLALVPFAVLTAGLAFWLVPESRDPAAPPIDVVGVLVASATVGLLVYTIIEAPHRGWGSAASVGGFVVTAVLALLLVTVEQRVQHPMIDLSVFRTRAFSAASLSITVAFFALFGFVFLVTQYFQFVRGYGPLSTGLRILPVAGSIATGAILSPPLVNRFGTRAVVMVGLTLLGGAFGWIAISPIGMGYHVIVGQMIFMGLGLGMTQVPATESILSVLPAAKAGVGSAVNDATREAGGTLGVAVVGSVFASLFASHVAKALAGHVSGGALEQAKASVGTAFVVAQRTGADQVIAEVRDAFMTAFHTGCTVALAVCWAGALAALALPGRARASAGTSETAQAAPADGLAAVVA